MELLLSIIGLFGLLGFMFIGYRAEKKYSNYLNRKDGEYRIFWMNRNKKGGDF